MKEESKRRPFRVHKKSTYEDCISNSMIIGHLVDRSREIVDHYNQSVYNLKASSSKELIGREILGKPSYGGPRLKDKNKPLRGVISEVWVGGREGISFSIKWRKVSNSEEFYESEWSANTIPPSNIIKFLD